MPTVHVEHVGIGLAQASLAGDMNPHLDCREHARLKGLTSARQCGSWPRGSCEDLDQHCQTRFNRYGHHPSLHLTTPARCPRAAPDAETLQPIRQDAGRPANCNYAQQKTAGGKTCGSDGRRASVSVVETRDARGAFPRLGHIPREVGFGIGGSTTSNEEDGCHTREGQNPNLVEHRRNLKQARGKARHRSS